MECVYPQWGGCAPTALTQLQFLVARQVHRKMLGRCAGHDRTPSAEESKTGGSRANFRPEIWCHNRHLTRALFYSVFCECCALLPDPQTCMVLTAEVFPGIADGASEYFVYAAARGRE